MRSRRAPFVTVALLASLAAGCAPPVSAASGGFPTSPAMVTGGVLYRYEVAAGPGAEELAVTADLPAGTDHLRAARGVLPYLRDVSLSLDHGAWIPLTASGDGFDLAGGLHAACRVRYRVLLGEAARDLDDRDTAQVHRGAYLAPSSTWLLRPARPLLDDRFLLHVTTAPGVNYVNGLFSAKNAPDQQEGRIADLEGSPYAAFGLAPIQRIELPQGELSVAMSAGAPALGREAIEKWIDLRVHAVASYYGRFPPPHAALLVLYTSGRDVGGGSTMGQGGASVQISLGERSTQAQLDDDWILVHELVHVSFPNVGTPWVEEGLASYVEPLIRARAGILTSDHLYRDLIDGLPQGQPQPGDRGLDHTDTWGRRYWGGALYWFLADVAIRKSTGNTHSIDGALQRIVAQGGNVSVTWSVDRALEEGDRDAGGTILRDLRHQLGDAAVTTDLEALWTELGVHLVNGKILYDDAAPLAAIRKAIAAPR
ncbi:MAG: hypothetical protein ABJE95_12220 [Byssovorax sp.]